MPDGDGTGPNGEGPRSGRGRGPCGNNGKGKNRGNRRNKTGNRGRNNFGRARNQSSLRDELEEVKERLSQLED